VTDASHGQFQGPMLSLLLATLSVPAHMLLNHNKYDHYYQEQVS